MRIATFSTNVDLAPNLPSWFNRIKKEHKVSLIVNSTTTSISVNMQGKMKRTEDLIGTLGGLSSTAINYIITNDITFSNGKVESISRNNNNTNVLRISCSVNANSTIPRDTIISLGMDPIQQLTSQQSATTHQEDTSLPNPNIRQRVNTAGKKKSSHRGSTNQYTDAPQQQPSVATSTTNVAVESASAPNQEDEDDVMAPASAPVSSRINGSARVSTSPNVQMEDAAVSASAPEPEEDVNMAAVSASTVPNQEPAPAAKSTASNQTSSTEFNAVTLANNAYSEGLKIAASDLSAEEKVNALFNSFDETKATSGCLENDVMKMCGLDKGEVLLRPMDGSSELLSLDEELISKFSGRNAAVNAAREGGLGTEIDKVMKGKKMEGNVWESLVVECHVAVGSSKITRGIESKGAHAGEGLNDEEYTTIADTVIESVTGGDTVLEEEVVKHVPNILRVLDWEKKVMQDDDMFKSLPKECQVAICTKLEMDWEGSEDESSEDDSSEEDNSSEQDDSSETGGEDNIDRKLLDADNYDEDQSW